MSEKVSKTEKVKLSPEEKEAKAKALALKKEAEAKAEDRDKTLYTYERMVRDDFKFRGEKPWVPYLWDLCQRGQGIGDVEVIEGSHKKWLITITQYDHDLYPTLRVGDIYAIVDDEQTDMVTGYIHERAKAEPD